MMINEEKTKVLPFNFTKKFDFTPVISLKNSEPLDVIYETKLLGIMISSDCSWKKNTQYICKKAAKRC